jgi:hypothetical protein
MARLVVYGCVLAIALLVWQVRSEDDRPASTRGPATVSADNAAAPRGPDTPWTTPPGRELRGAVNGYRVSAYAHEGAVRQLILVTPAPCSRSPWQSMQVTLDEREFPFSRIGRRFTAAQTTTLEPDAAGLVASLRIVARGALSADGRHASGAVSMTVVWRRAGVAVDSCQAPPTRWSASRL